MDLRFWAIGSSWADLLLEKYHPRGWAPPLKTRFLVPATLTALLAWFSYADADMPVYNPTAYCDQVAKFGGAASDVIRSGCLRRERTARDGLKAAWDQLPLPLRQHCDEEARYGGGGSFVILKDCVDKEQNAGQPSRLFPR